MKKRNKKEGKLRKKVRTTKRKKEICTMIETEILKERRGK